MLSAAVIEMICSLVKGAGWPSGHLEEVRTEEAGEEGEGELGKRKAPKASIRNSSREGGMKCGFGSTRLTAALRKKTALLFVNQASALAGKGNFSTQPSKCYANY